jgi:hypothetical protein
MRTASAVQDAHEEDFSTSVRLSSFQVERAILPQDVIRVLNDAKIRFVLVGAYGLAGWIRDPRATQDVDVVVAERQVQKAVRVLLAEFTNLEAVDLPVVVRLREREAGKVFIDVMKPVQPPYRQIFKHTHEVRAAGQEYRVPSLEMAIVTKFSAMTSLYRADEDKYQDAHDFILMVKNNPGFDREKLVELGSLMYEDGGKDVLELARKALAGEKLNV